MSDRNSIWAEGENTGRWYRWNGHHTVNIYDDPTTGTEIDAYQFGDFAKNRETVEEFLASVDRHEEGDHS